MIKEEDFDPTAFEQDIAAEIGLQQDADETLVNEEPSKYKQQPHRQAQILVIDCHAIRPMFSDSKNSDSLNWKNLFMTLTEYAKSRIISNDSDKWGLLLFGTEQTDNQYKMPHLVEILPIDFLTIEGIRAIMNLSTLTFDKFLHTYGSLSETRSVSHRHETAACPISAVFRYALRAIRTAAPVFKFTRKILLFTHRADPCANLPNDRVVAKQLGSDLIDNNVVIDLFPLSLGGDKEHFDLKIFYKDLIEKSAKQGLANLFEAAADQFADQTVSEKVCLSLLSTLKTELRRRATQSRVLQKVEVKVCPNVCISCAVFLVIGEAKKPAPVLLRAEDHKPLYTETVWIDSGTGNLLAKPEMRKYYDFAGLRAVFSEDEMNDIKAIQTRPRYSCFPDQNHGTHRMTILGYKPINALDRTRLSIKLQVYFLFPSENEISGSFKLFHSLIKSMWTLHRMAVLTWQYRANSAPRMFAGVPQVGEDVDGRPLVGMFLIAIPFADEIRPTPLDSTVSEAVVNAVYDKLGIRLTEMLDNLSIDQREKFPPIEEIANPTLARHFAGLEALALGAQELGEVKDATLPDQTFFDALKPQLAHLNEAFGCNRGKKRALSAAKETAAQVDINQVRKMAEHSKLNALTVPQLKSALTMLGLNVSGRKAELIDRLNTNFKSKGK